MSRLFQPQPFFYAGRYRRYVPSKASSDLSVTVDAGAVTLAGQTAAASFDVPVSAGAVSLAGQAVTVALGLNVSIAAGAVTVAGQSITTALDLPVSSGALTLAGQSVAPSLDVPLAAGALTAAGESAEVSFDVPVSAGALTVSGQTVTPSLTGNIDISLDAGGLTLTGQTVDISLPVANEVIPGGFWFAFEQAQLRRKKKLREIEEAEEEAQSIKERMDREIALLLREQERQDTERQEQQRLRELARRYATDRAQDLYGERVAKAMARAAVQGNFSAIEALVREAKRAQEEEIFLLQATAMAIELNG